MKKLLLIIFGIIITLQASAQSFKSYPSRNPIGSDSLLFHHAGKYYSSPLDSLPFTSGVDTSLLVHKAGDDMTGNLTFADSKGIMWSSGNSLLDASGYSIWGLEDGMEINPVNNFNVNAGQVISFAADSNIHISTPRSNPSRAQILDASGYLISSVTTDAELAYVHGATSNIQTQLNTKASSVSVAAKQDTALASGKIRIGQSYGGGLPVTPSGDVTTSNAGVNTIANDAVTYAKMQNISSGSLIGRSTAGSGDPESIAVGSGLSLSGGTLTAPTNAAKQDTGTTVLRNGTRAMTADWGIGGFRFTGLKSLAISGTGGNGYMFFPAQSTRPSANASTGFVLSAGSTGNFGWKITNGADTMQRAFSGTLSGSRVYTWQDSSYTVAGLNIRQAWPSKQTFTGNATEFQSISLLDATYKTAFDVPSSGVMRIGLGFSSVQFNSLSVTSISSLSMTGILTLGGSSTIQSNGTGSNALQIKTSNAGTSGSLTLSTGDKSGSGNSGSVIITTGAAGTGGTKGNINISGSSDGSSAASGIMGEVISSTISTYANYTTTATYQNITSITLTAGDWDISGFATFSTNSATLTANANAIIVISTTTASASGSTEGSNIAYINQNISAAGKQSVDINSYQVTISSTTTYYLNTQATFTGGNPQYVGSLRARRMR